MGIYEKLELSEAINKNKDEYKNMFTFGNKNDIVNQENLIDEEIDKISKLIHKGYGNVYNPEYIVNEEEWKEIDKKWFNSANFSDKLSSISQARHIDIKLKTLGLKKIKSKDAKEKLLAHNRKIFNKAFENTNGIIKRSDEISDEKLKEYSKELDKLYRGENFEVRYFPKDFTTTLFDKMINMEHNRWTTHHYLEGWKYKDKKSKEKKEHNYLKPLSEFKEKSMQLTIIYDMYSFLYLPNYLAEAGYKIEQIETTGDRVQKEVV